MTTAPDPPAPPPEAELIRLARQARALSPAKAAKLMPTSMGPSRWRHIENGYSTRDKPVRAPDATLAHMAHVVGVSPEQLREAGRETAAEILEAIIKPGAPPAASGAAPQPTADGTHLSALARDRRAELGLTLEQLAARCIDPESKSIEPQWTADELEQLERGERPPLSPSRLQALSTGLGLPMGRLQDAAGVEYHGITSVWQPSTGARALVRGWETLSPEDRDKIMQLINTWAKK